MKKGDFLLIGLGFGGLALLGICYGYTLKKLTEAPKNAEPILKAPEQPIKVVEERSRFSHIINHHLNEANKWYEIKLEPGVKTWQFRARDTHELSYAFDPTHANYMTLGEGETLTEDTVPNRDINAIYVMCADASVVVEMEVWL